MVHVRCLEGRAIMRQTELKLSKQDRHKVEEFRSRGSHMAREVNRAHVLAALDDGVAENQIMAVLGVGRTAIWRTRAAYREAGLEFALRDVARPGKPRRYAGDEEARVAALACSEPPPGAKRWTVVLLTEAARSQPGMRHISRETVRRFLKKTSSNRGAS
jgi:transposase